MFVMEWSQTAFRKVSFLQSGDKSRLRHKAIEICSKWEEDDKTFFISNRVANGNR